MVASQRTVFRKFAIFLPLLGVIQWFFCTSCSAAGNGGFPGDSDADTEGNSDTDTDSDGDADGDSDGDTDTTIPNNPLDWSVIPAYHSPKYSLAVIDVDDVILCAESDIPWWFNGEEAVALSQYFPFPCDFPGECFYCEGAFAASEEMVVVYGRMAPDLEKTITYRRIGGAGGTWEEYPEMPATGCIWAHLESGESICVKNDPRETWKYHIGEDDWLLEPSLAPSEEVLPTITEICPGDGSVFVVSEPFQETEVFSWVDGQLTALGYPLGSADFSQPYLAGARCIWGSVNGGVIVLAPRNDVVMAFNGDQWSTIVECPQGIVPSYLTPDELRKCWVDAVRDPVDGAIYLSGGLDCGDGPCPEDDRRIHRWHDGSLAQVLMPCSNTSCRGGPLVVKDGHIYALVGYMSNFQIHYAQLTYDM